MKPKMIFVFALLMLAAMHSATAQQRSISGTITDQDGITLPGVNILVKGTIRGTQSDFNGDYVIQASTGETLVFSYTGQ